MTNETSYESVVLSEDTGVIRGLPTDDDQRKAEEKKETEQLS